MRGAIAYEWRRITTVRSTYWFSAMAIVFSALIAFFIARGEVKRRRKAEEKKAEEKKSLDRESPGDSRASGATDSRS